MPMDTTSTTTQTGEQQAQQIPRWQQARMSVATTYAETPAVLRCGGVVIGTLGNFSVSIGKAKSKKSFNVSAIAAAALTSKGKVLDYEVDLPADKQHILYVDTEQSKVDCQRVMKRILTLAGRSDTTDCEHLVFLALREVTPEERIALIDEAMAAVPGIGLVIIDGVRDLLHDINNPTEATMVVSQLMKWTDRYQFHLHTVLHQNKSDENARGHIGTELDNKSETVMQVEKDRQDADVSVVKSVFTRAADFPPFAFRINEDALPELLTDYQFKEAKPGRPAKEEFNPAKHITLADHENALRQLFDQPGKVFGSYFEFQSAITETYKQLLGQFNSGKATKVIRFYLDKGMTVQDASRKYSLNPAYHFSDELARPQMVQPTLFDNAPKQDEPANLEPDEKPPSQEEDEPDWKKQGLPFAPYDPNEVCPF